MRLLVAILWILAAVCWLPWFALLIRYLAGFALGDQAAYFSLVFMGVWPGLNMGLWPLDRLLLWQIISWYPVSALMGMALVAIGWLIYWREQDGLLTRPARAILVSILLPPVAPFLLWGDARRRHVAKEIELERGVIDARDRIEAG